MAAKSDPLSELKDFLKPSTRLDVRIQAVNQVLGLTGTLEGQQIFLQRPDLLEALSGLLFDSSKIIVQDALLAIVNLTANENLSKAFLKYEAAAKLLDLMLDPAYSFADHVCMSLSNITRSEEGSRFVLEQLVKPNNVKMVKLVDAFCVINYNNSKAKLNYISTIFANLTQLKESRVLFLDKTGNFLQRLLPFIHYKDSVVRRGGTVGLVRNLCFESDFHEWLLSEEIDLLSTLLLPLAGPEELDEDIMDKLPDDLQYLPEDKEREPDPDIRKMLLESLMQLCATEHGRRFLRDKQTYYIIREYHRWEKDTAVLACCEQLISMLIADEPESGMENLHKVTVPDEIVKKFEEQDLKEASVGVSTEGGNEGCCTNKHVDDHESTGSTDSSGKTESKQN